MAVLEKIRVKFGILITVLVALALLSFIIDPTTLQNAFQMFSDENKVGEMNGESIGYKDYYEEVDKYTGLYEMLGQSVGDEQSQAMVRNMAWQAMFDENVFLPKAEKAGIFVGDGEMKSLSQGENISPVLLQQGLFNDENGEFSRAKVLEFVQSIDNDPSGRSARYWDFIESSIYKARMYEKYTNLLAAATVQNPVEKARVIADNSVTYDVDYITVPVNFAPDSTISISQAEIKEYYDARKNNMQQPANRDIKYVMWEVVPSQKDFTEAKADFDEKYAEFATAENLRNFITVNSDDKWDNYFYSESQLSNRPEFQALAFGKTGSVVSDVLSDDDSFSAARVAARAQMSDSVQVMYMLFPLTQEAAADSVLAIAEKSGATADFQPLGAENMWVTQEMTNAGGISDINAIFNANAGKAMKIRSINAQGFFVLCITARTKPVDKVQLAVLSKNVLPSDDTYRDFLMKATDFADRCAGKEASFDEAAKADGLLVETMPNVIEATRRIGSCDNARELVRWIFDKKTDEGSVSEVISLDNKYHFVASVTKVREEGTIALEDVQGKIKDEIEMDRKIEKLQAEVKEKIASCKTLDEVSSLLGSSISHVSGASFGSQYQQIDEKVLGALANAKEGELCGPCKGMFGVVVYQVAKREEGSFFTAEDADTYQNQKTAFQVQMLESALMKEAGVKDYRPRFF